MRILFANIVYPTPGNPTIVGGAEVSVKALAETLSENGHQVAVIRGHGPDIEDTAENVNNVAVHSLKIRNFYWPFDGVERGKEKKAVWHLIDNLGLVPRGVGEIMDEFRPDVIHTNNLIGLTWGIWREAANRNIPIMHVLRDYYLICGRSARFRDRKICNTTCGECRIATFRRAKMTNLVGAVSGNSRAILDTHLSQGLFSRAKIQTNIANIATPRNIARIKSTKLRFGFIGRASAEKGLELLASAFGKTGVNTEFVIAGETRDDVRDNLRQIAGREINFVGFVKPEVFYSQVDVVVVPSLWAEPLPRAVLEAYSYGIPVIGSDRGGIPEAIGPNGGGWLFDPDDEGSLVRVMLKLQNNPGLLERASLQATERARDFSQEKIVSAHLNVLTELVKRK